MTAQSPTLRELIYSRHYLYMADPGSGLNETSLRQRLKRETAAAHQHLEDQVGLLDPGLDVHRYLRVLERFYGFYVPVEIDLTRLAAEVPVRFPLRARVELIACDLHHKVAPSAQPFVFSCGLITRSGTNDFHGSAYEFLRNDALEARGSSTKSDCRFTGISSASR